MPRLFALHRLLMVDNFETVCRILKDEFPTIALWRIRYEKQIILEQSY
jgi:hypothetical protein